MKKLIILSIILILVLMGFTNSQAQKKREKFNDKKYALKELNLTELQKEKIKEIKFNHAEANIATEAKLKMNRLEIKKLLSNKNIDENTLMPLIEESSDLKLIMKKSKVKMWLEIRDILDENQKTIWSRHFDQLEKREDRTGRKDKRKIKRFDGKERIKN
ncbi:MAG: Spy/CpxP family protein refolding chaperone [Melioribacteraceae bacterium]|nr:Spy/CpxP family protein refolding chaperone [Melioribacteraceae bacterium]